MEGFENSQAAQSHQEEVERANVVVAGIAHEAVAGDEKLLEQERDKMMDSFFAARGISPEQRAMYARQIEEEATKAGVKAEEAARVKAVLGAATEIVKIDKKQAEELKQATEQLLKDQDDPRFGPPGRNQQYREMVSRIENTQFGRPGEVN